MQDSPVYVSLEFTPNPNTLKYSVNRMLLEQGTLNFPTAADAQSKSPLAEKLFEVKGISGVMFGRDFVTITKSDEGNWDAVNQSVSKLIDDHLSRELPVAHPEALSEINEPKGTVGNSETETKIRQILDEEIRPAVAQDGGDITFDRFEDGIVYLYLQGSCAGCPSATATLKMGIEDRLKQILPEVKEVKAI